MAAKGTLAEQLLPNELWAAIFALLALEQSADHDPGQARTLQQHRLFHQIRTVCKQFDAVVCQNAALFSHLLVSDSQQSKALPSLMLWLNKFGANVTTLEIFGCSPGAEAILSAFIGSSLCALCLRECDKVKYNILSDCTRLTSCTLQQTAARPHPIDLQRLPFLTYLCLQDGHFSGDHRLCSLTSLDLKDSALRIGALKSVEFKGPCSLCTLKLSNAHYTLDSSAGLTAMINLECLHISNSYVGAHSKRDVLDVRTHRPFIPSGLSALTKLSELRFDVTNIDRFDISFDWLRHFTNMRSLSIGFCQLAAFVFVGDMQLTSLAKLESLELICADVDPPCTICLDIDFLAFPRLQSISISNGSFRLDGANVKDLLQLKSLRHINFHHAKPDDGQSLYHAAALGIQLKQSRPEVQLIIQKES